MGMRDEISKKDRDYQDTIKDALLGNTPDSTDAHPHRVVGAGVKADFHKEHQDEVLSRGNRKGSLSAALDSVETENKRQAAAE
jgi:hypothetical protein